MDHPTLSARTLSGRHSRRSHLSIQALELPSLPPELWTTIFQFLSADQLLRVRLTCHYWRNIVDNSSRLTAKFLVTCPNGMRVGLASVSPKAGSSWWRLLGKICMNECECELWALLQVLVESPNLKILNMDSVRMSCKSKRPLNKVQLVKMETFVFCYDCEPSTAELFLENFRELCPRLHDLTIVPAYDDLDVNLYVCVMECVYKWQNKLENLSLIVNEELMVKLMDLKDLKLRELELHAEQPLPNNRILIDLCKIHPNLKYLNVMHSFALSCSELTEIGKLLPNLKQFGTQLAAVPITQSTFVDSMPGLQSLTLASDWDDGAILPKIRTHSLTELTLSYLRFTHDSLREYLSTTPKLRKLTLFCCHFSGWSSVFQAVQQLHQLETLELIMLTAPSRLVNCANPALENLKTLKIASSKLKQRTLIALISNCPRLENLSLKNAQIVLSEVVVQVMHQKLKRLTKLTISGCNLSDAGKQYIERMFDSLDVLKIEN